MDLHGSMSGSNVVLAMTARLGMALLLIDLSAHRDWWFMGVPDTNMSQLPMSCPGRTSRLPHGVGDTGSSHCSAETVQSIYNQASG